VLRDGYIPDWSVECSRCGSTPCVNVVRQGHIRHVSELCGVCFFSDHAMLDPELWNEREEEEWVSQRY
jgi:hypothetical protein